MNKRITGKNIEDYAEELLRKKGYEILERNFHFSTEGEIDIIAEDKEKNQLVFVEVKGRRSTSHGYPEESISPKKMNQIKKVSEYYLYKKDITDKDCRYDVITILKIDNNKMEVRHLIDAFY